MAKTELRRVPIHRVGYRPNLFLGGDRELTMYAIFLNFSLAATALNWFATAVAVLLSAASVYLLRKMAKADPRMRDVYFRHRKYSRYYPARSTPFRENTRSQEKLYK